MRPRVSPVERVRAGLRLFWPGTVTDVRLQGEEMQVAVRFPKGTRERQKQWSCDFVRWVTGEKQNVSVFDSFTGRPVPDARGSSSREDFSDQIYWELARAAKLQRYIQSDLNGKFGGGSTLILIDAESSKHGAYRDPRLYAIMDPPQNFFRREPFQLTRIHACLAVSRPDLIEKAQRSVRPALDEKRGDELRVVVIP